VPNPGHKHVWRIYDGRGKATADLLSLSEEEIRPHEKICLYHPIDAKISRTMNAENVSETELLLEDIMLDGKVVYNWPSIDSMRTLRDRDLQRLDAGVKRIMNPHIYHVSITKKLWDLKQELINHLEVSEKNASLGEL
jgi:nicotinate phosphoribosyltransferase